MLWRNNLKKIICCLVLIITFVCFAPTIYANAQVGQSTEILSHMTEDECLDFIIQNNITIPSSLDDETTLKSLVKETIQQVEANSNYVFSYNFGDTQKFVEDIKNLVNNYYGISTDNSISYLSSISNYQLQYNYVYGNGEWRTSGGEWNSKWEYYNCFAYSINRSDRPRYYNPDSLYIQYQPGDFAGTGSFSSSMTIATLANIIKDDLEAIGLTNIIISDSIPTNLYTNQKLICVRKCSRDYHFMRFDPETNAWYHKPGKTAILKYKYTPSNNNNWIAEGSYEGEEFYGGTIYDSPIKYIVYNIDNITLNCRTSETVTNKNISQLKDTIYEIIVECSKTYNITSTAASAINMTLYDSNMDITSVSPTMTNNDCTGTINTYLSKGTYFLRLNYANSTSSGNITTSYKAAWPNSGYQVFYNTENNILDHLHHNLSDGLENKLYYINTKGAGIYKITLNATKTDGSTVIFPNEAIKVYDHMDEGQEFKYDVLGYSKLAENDYGINSFYIYLPRNGYFYIHINMPDAEYSNMTLSITPTDSETIEMLDRMTSIFTEELFDEAEFGDYAKSMTFTQTGKFKIDFSTIDDINGDILLVLFKNEYNCTTGNYYKIDKFAEYLNNSNKTRSVTRTLDPGTYYIGYFNNSTGANIKATLTRILQDNPNMSTAMVADPNMGYSSGSEVRFNNGQFGNHSITEGFTRNLYFISESGILPSLSRLDYDWYSSNTYIATVSQFGTVYAKGVTSNTTVTIYAVYKADASLIYSRTFNILNDTSEEIIEIVCNMTYSYSSENGTYQIELSELNCPYPWIQYYTWTVFVPCQETDILVSIGQWGEITATGPGYAELTGQYSINPRVYVKINLTITE